MGNRLNWASSAGEAQFFLEKVTLFAVASFCFFLFVEVMMLFSPFFAKKYDFANSLKISND